MDLVQPRGDQNSPIYFIGHQPSEQDEAKGTVFMDTQGWFLDKLIQEAGLGIPYLLTLQPSAKVKLPDQLCMDAIIALLDAKKPPLIVTCDSRREKGEKQISDCLLNFCPETKGDLGKYAGSLLHSPFVPYPHYVLPIVSSQYIFENYSEKDIVVSIDLARVKEEVDWYEKHNRRIQPLPDRKLLTEPSYDELMYWLLAEGHSAQYLATDIETIRPHKDDRNASEKSKSKSAFKGHPGFPYTLSFASSPFSGVSFSYWDYEIEQLLKIWREIDWLLSNIPQIGQNYFMFDCIFKQAFGFRPCVERCEDTLIRHHILWPELPHSLQFQTRQYTRQPYYKDEGKQWSPKYKKSLMHYNCLDTVVDFECFLKQEEEFADRPHLKGDKSFYVR